MKDKYDQYVERLRSIPDEVFSRRIENNYWNRPYDEEEGTLFLYCNSDGDSGFYDVNGVWEPCGCLTQVKNGSYEAFTKELTDAIRADERIPSDPKDITKENLSVFAEWRRKIDVMANKVED
jgi:hypothetical protein